MVAVMKPKLPQAEALLPYLRRVDARRTYSNFGPLNTEFEARIAQLYGSSEGTVMTASNATIALTLALNALGAPRGTLCAMPAWTFVASAHAATMAGLTPYFIDVDPATWALDPQATAAALANAPGEVAAVMPVAPFGLALDIPAWEAFRNETGIAVVIDAAAGFDSARPSSIPTVVSLHATKALGVGEGALVLSIDPDLIVDIRTRSNFGFHGSREARLPAANGKLSEYHAAVGLAALDEWPEARAEWMAAATAYRRALSSNRVKLQPGFGETWAGSTCVLEFPEPWACSASQALAAAGIETRRWWGMGAHRHPATVDFPCAVLAATEHLAGATLGVPFYRDIGTSEIDQIAHILRSIGA